MECPARGYPLAGLVKISCVIGTFGFSGSGFNCNCDDIKERPVLRPKKEIKNLICLFNFRLGIEEIT